MISSIGSSEAWPSPDHYLQSRSGPPPKAGLAKGLGSRPSSPHTNLATRFMPPWDMRMETPPGLLSSLEIELQHLGEPDVVP